MGNDITYYIHLSCGVVITYRKRFNHFEHLKLIQAIEKTDDSDLLILKLEDDDEIWIPKRNISFITSSRSDDEMEVRI